ncbi:hypothetical protein E3Q22_02053 [Wallemia mellicola]|uniref:Amino acid transporter transmembrane domain-containing protein n=1 Tax=Wallemia mellicola TaxID=1708541 RepID=A0A4V4MZG6_9BASI|nr:hypothetical protein E3Q24_03414 [Wallemia mellicola]TIB79440.1 hypothetical protein E3Q23_00245 [Wallemia mellicola]TIB80157.1 hypothetical protein E3Q22_02053 [Wallemia mellicola]TIB88360.1 hypothetical protein E3Q21_00992 [Wallemia mellicola]TIB91136.1 hypothetical protein E3Q20_00979 [Wallemia mellicola]
MSSSQHLRRTSRANIQIINRDIEDNDSSTSEPLLPSDKQSKESEGSASIGSCVANLANTTGMLAMPDVLSSTGIIPGMILILFCAFMSSFGLYLLSLCSDKLPPRSASFNAIAKITYPTAAMYFDLAIALKCFGVSISYLLILGQLVPPLVTSFFHHLTPSQVDPPSWLLSRHFWITVFVILLSPLASMRQLNSLRHTSYVSIFSAGYLLLIVVLCAVHSPIPLPPAGNVSLGRFDASAISKFPVLVFAFTCAQNFFPVKNELRSNTRSRTTTVIGSSIGVASGLYEIIGVLGYVTFGDNVNSNVMSMYPDTSIFISFGRLAIVILVLSSYPLQVHPCRNSLDKVIRTKSEKEKALASQDEDSEDDEIIKHPPSKTKHTILTISILLLTWAVSMVVTQLDKVLAFVGSTGSTIISFILPGLFYRALTLNDDEPSRKWLRVGSRLLIFYGASVMIFCLAFNFYELFTNSTSTFV